MDILMMDMILGKIKSSLNNITKIIHLINNLDKNRNFSHKKSGWTEEQEDELRQLYQENQENPSTEQGK